MRCLLTAKKLCSVEKVNIICRLCSGRDPSIYSAPCADGESWLFTDERPCAPVQCKWKAHEETKKDRYEAGEVSVRASQSGRLPGTGKGGAGWLHSVTIPPPPPHTQFEFNAQERAE